MDHRELDIEIEEVQLSEFCDYCGKQLIETQIRKEFDVIIIAVKKQDGRMEFNPGPSTVIDSDDTLITMGERKNLEQLKKKAGVQFWW